MIETERLILRHWQDEHFEAFADMHCDPTVMADLGGPVTINMSKEKFERYRRAEIEHGIARWAVEDRNGLFLGYAGVMPRMSTEHPLGPHHEIGWRFKKSAWGQGYATESAKAALSHVAKEASLADILSYTGPENLRSQAVMARIGLVRKPSLDFLLPIEDDKVWHGLVWTLP
ncbi:GNAT family N-acetyltransferase [Roseibium litorale]|uniref:GNAT family N-acetyltransferase n=1 Tax=Roseibium litorale TaxID=2803841 RepID=A0ABR9CPD2_9HYPH|nr:GNAT family N-acetyltransferase [Roseibium litorale]MBD8892697.1 GNAT family N-acetyltransferase [Roseibium litorale]